MYGLEAEDAERLTYKIVNEYKWDRLSKEKDLTKSEILKGYKKEVIDYYDSVSLLTDLGYAEWEAQYILELERVVEVGDPEGYWDMKKVTEAYKKALGVEAKVVPESLLVWEKRVKQLREEKKKLEEEKASEEEIAKKAIDLLEAEGTYRKIMVEWQRLKT